MIKISDFKKTKCFMIYILLLIASAAITYIINPNIKEVIDTVSSGIPEHVSRSTGVPLVIAYIKNNGFSVPLQMLLFSLLPIPFLYLVQPSLTAVLPGILFGIVLRYDLKEGIAITISSLPHAFIELLGICLFANLLYNLNNCLYKKLYKRLFKMEQNNDKLRHCVIDMLKYYCFLVLPVIAIAGIVETYISDLLRGLLISLI